MLTLGLSVVIFLAIGAIVMTLFCLITKYFNKKLEKALDDENQVYSMIQEIRGKGDNQNEDDDSNDYENFVNQRENDALKQNQKNQPFELQMTDIKEPLKGYDEGYGMGKLKRRLEGQAPSSIPMNPETGRSISSLKSFKPEKLDDRKNSVTNRSNLSDPNSEGGESNETNRDLKKRDRKDKRKDQVTIHKYTSKIVSYIEEGIIIIENNLLSVSKSDQINEKRSSKNSMVKPTSSSFDDTLEAYGFEKGTFCAFKFQTTLQIPHMKEGEEYSISSLKSTESKEEIEFPEFYNLKDKIENN